MGVAVPSEDFEAAARSALSFLRGELGLDAVVVSRRVDAHYIVLAADGDHDGQAGTVLAWNDALCGRVIAGDAPAIAATVDAAPLIAAAPDLRSPGVGAYVCVPMHDRSGDVTGALCGVSSSAKDESFATRLPLVRLLADLLGSLLQHERDLHAAERAAERARSYAHTDPLTGAGNRRHWAATLTTEAERFRRYANPYAVVVLDLEALPTVKAAHGRSSADEMICLAAEMIMALVRPSDTVARLGGDQFGILAVECDRDGASALTARLTNAFAVVGLDVAIGMAVSKAGQSGRTTWNTADAAADASKHTIGSLVDLV